MSKKRGLPRLTVEIGESEAGPDIAVWRQTIELLCRWALEQYFEDHPEARHGAAER